MSARYFYLDIELKLQSPEPLYAQQLIQGATKVLFGECGVISTDILNVHFVEENCRVLVRVPAKFLRKLRAALALSTKVVCVHNEAPSLQALV